MKNHGKKLAKKIICLLLCLLMLPLVRVSAAGYNDAFNTLVAIAKTGSPHNDGEYNYYVNWGDAKINGREFDLQYYSPIDGKSIDYLVISCNEPASSGQPGIVLFLAKNEPDNVQLIFGNEDGYGEATINSRYSLNGDIRLDYYDGSVSEKAFKQTYNKYIKYVLEYIDLKLHTKNANLSIQDIFKNVNPKSLHNLSKSWIEKADTCTVDGSTGYQCADCGVRYFEPIKAHHNWELVQEITPATEEHGSGKFRCGRCGQEKTDVLCVSSAFTDVPAFDNWAHPGIDWAVYNGITNGTSGTTFSPGQGCTRGQVVTFLWRAAGQPEPKSTKTPFTDLKPGAFYEKAVAWAVEKKITSGTSAATFSPDATCTRGQIVTFLWRFKGATDTAQSDSHFTDVKRGAFYEKAVAWAELYGVTAGTSPTQFSPDATCTRAQVVTFLYRAQKNAPDPIELKDLVGVSMPTESLMRWNQDGENLKQLLEEAGCDVSLQYANNNPDTQISQIEKMITDGAKVIIVAAIDSYALDSVLDQARQAGCTVIAYDRPITSDSVDYYTSFDNFAVGAAQGRFIADQLDLENAGGKTFNLELVCGAPDDGNAYVFYDGAMSVLQPYIDAGTLHVVSGQVDFEEVATEGWSTENAQNRFERILSSYYTDRQLDAVMCSNDSTAQGVAVALENAYLNDVYPILTGQDCDLISVRNMLDGRQAMSVFKDTRNLTAKTVEMTVAILEGNEPPVNAQFTTADGAYTYPAFYCDPTVCTKDQIQSLLIDSGYYTWEDLGH